jgi:hypothetical protein
VPELSTEENERIVARVYEAAMAVLHAGRPVSAAQRLLHDVEHMMQEANSGASTPEQEEALGDLFPQLEEENGRVTNALDAYAKQAGA